MSHQPTSNLVKDDKGNPVADFHSISNRWKNYFSVFDAHGANDVRYTEIHAAGPLVPQPQASELERANEKLNRHKSQSIDQIPEKNLLKQKLEQFILRSINLLFLFGIWTNCLSSGRSQPLYLFIKRMIKQAVVIIQAHHSSTKEHILPNILHSRLTSYADEIMRDNECGL
jgi:hypothetical protein